MSKKLYLTYPRSFFGFQYYIEFGLTTAILQTRAIKIQDPEKISVRVDRVIFREIELDRRYDGVFANFCERKTSNADNAITTSITSKSEIVFDWKPDTLYPISLSMKSHIYW